MSLVIETEIKIDSEPCVGAWNNNKLLVGTDAGSIFSFSENLATTATWKAHEVQIFALAATKERVYSASNDGGARIWNWQGEKIDVLPATGTDIGSIGVHDKYVYIGDEVGNILVFENKTLKGEYNVLEEVKALVIRPPYMFTVRDLYVTVTEIKPEESKHLFVTQHTMEGRAPLSATKSHLLVTARGGNSLQLHDISIDTKFKKLHEVKVSDMIVTSVSASGDFCWTGGWDGYVRRWKIVDNQLQAAGELNLGACINAVLASSGEKAYILITGGRIVLIKAS